ncbi:hypothetical protein F5882DRAFT_471407 [Hyaloscypha sp. PMI_1271]|nr:hypothetical protein F5882DRAFT_471407 [Hyaloscypha sp. PMI_1271]
MEAPGKNFLIAFLDFSRGPDTELWLYSSLENPANPGDDAVCTVRGTGPEAQGPPSIKTSRDPRPWLLYAGIRTLDLREDLPFLKSVTALTLADDFDSRGLRPIVPYSIRYIHTINEDIWRAEEELDPHRRQQQVQRAIEQHLPWLTTRLSDLVTIGGDDDFCLLACFVRHIIFEQDTIASSLLRSLLFMLVANLSQRSEQIRLATL